jgi:hypothetical protein
VVSFPAMHARGLFLHVRCTHARGFLSHARTWSLSPRCTRVVSFPAMHARSLFSRVVLHAVDLVPRVVLTLAASAFVEDATAT